ncbi:unnamed protein product [Brassica rapa]|uniref:Uncharacterized protein n=1 Tax=Brassica campestris TaxID=3711 RepID=A0A8D9DJD7_BRACM|nr:unnamed protein product [Brassica rapa]
MLVVNLYSPEDNSEALNKTQKHKYVDEDKLMEGEGKGKNMKGEEEEFRHRTRTEET